MSTTVIYTVSTDLETEIKDIKSLEKQIKDLKDLQEQKENIVKKALEQAEVEEMQIGTFTVRFQNVTRNNFCTSDFKKKYLELYNAFIKQTCHRKFTIS